MAAKTKRPKAPKAGVRNTKAGKPKTGTFLRVKDLPNERLRSVAKQFKPAVEKVTKQFPPLDAIKVMLAAIQEELYTEGKPQSNLAMAVGRGLLAREELKQQEGGSVSAEEARLELGGMSKEAVLKRYRKGQLLGWREAKQGAIRFPVWQFEEGNVLGGIPETLAILNEAPWIDDWARILFFLNPRSSIRKKRPLDLLRNGKTERVLDLAQAEIR